MSVPHRTRTQLVVARCLRWNFRVVMALRLWGQVRVHGRENIPATGAVLVVSNHLGAGDPPLLWTVFPRQLWFMAMSPLFAIPVLRTLIRAAGAFPVQRDSADRQALRTALTLLRAGEPVAIYPEGERTVCADLEPPRAGVGYLALLSRVPILPVGMAGSERILPRRAVRPRQRGIDVWIGAPFLLPEGLRDRDAAAEEIMRRIAVLLPADYRGYLRNAESGTVTATAPLSGVSERP